MIQKEYYRQMDQFLFEMGKRMRHGVCKNLKDGISMPHIHLLKYIQYKNQCIVSDVANHFDITLSGVTSLVNKLVHLNLVNRERSEQDRRLVIIQLTDEGKKVLEKTDENRINLYNKCFENLDDEEIQTFLTLANKITCNIVKD